MGAYWNLTSLWALAYPEYYNGLVNSQLLVYKDAGWLGDGIAASRYVSGVGTNMVSITRQVHTIVVFVILMLKRLIRQL